jgi:hypothetical protein
MYKETFIPEDSLLLYFYAKDKKKFQEVINQYTDYFNSKGIKNEEVKQLIILSLNITEGFRNYFDNGIKINQDRLSGVYENFKTLISLQYLKKQSGGVKK